MKNYYSCGEPIIGTVFDETDIEVINTELRKMMRSDYDYHSTISEFEKRFAQYIGNKFAVAVNSCATGIDMVLRYIGLKEGDEVISCAINFHGTHLAIINAGARLVLAEPESSLNICPHDLRQRITKKTKAIIVTHMNGLSCDMDSIEDMVNELEESGQKIYIIEDAARACGGEYKNRKIGNKSWAAIFSFQYKKHISTLGEGGMIVTYSPDLAAKLNAFRSFGNGCEWGTNYKMTSVQAAVGINQLQKLDALIKKRRALAHERSCIFERYLPDFRYPKDNDVYYNAFYLYTILTPEDWSESDRDLLMQILKIDFGVGTVVANKPTYITNEWIGSFISPQKNRVAEDIAKHIICLPLHPAMTCQENSFIISAFCKAASKVRRINN